MRCWLLFFSAILLLSGCASVSVTEVTDRPKVRPTPPDMIYVEDFETPPDVFRVDRGGEAYERFRATYARQLAYDIALRATKRLAPAKVIARGKAPKRSGATRAWLVTGRFTRVNQGSRVLRTALGFGLGGTKVETDVMVYDLSRPGEPPVLEFSTTGGTNSQPGVLVGLVVPNFWLMGLDAAVRIWPGLRMDGIRTSREIVAVLSEYMARHDLLPPKQVYRAKNLGKWP